MRILHLRNSHLVGGPERLLVDQGRRAAPGYEGTLASFGSRGGAHPFLQAAGEAGLHTHRVEQAGSYDPRIVGRVRRHLREQRYDLLVGHDYKANLVLALAARGLATPRVAVLHGYTGEDPKVRLFEAIDRRLLRGAAAVVAVSRDAADLLRSAGVREEKIHVIANGIDVARVVAEAAAGRESRVGDGVVIATVGRLSPEKNQMQLLDAFSGLKDDVSLLVVGDGPERRVLEEAVRTNGIGGRVRFTGWRSDATRLLGTADIFALPSLREGLPLALLEAMAAGLPVVASAVGGVIDVLEKGPCGELVAGDDVGALRRALARLAEDPARRAELGRLARERVASAYDVALQTRALEDLYASVAVLHA